MGSERPGSKQEDHDASDAKLGARLRAVVLGEEAVFVAMSHGVKLYRLDAALQTRWSSQVMPANYWNGLLHSDQEQLAWDEQGNILVAWSMVSSQAQAYRLHFGRALPWRGGRHDIVVQRFGQSDQGDMEGGKADALPCAA